MMLSQLITNLIDTYFNVSDGYMKQHRNQEIIRCCIQFCQLNDYIYTYIFPEEYSYFHKEDSDLRSKIPKPQTTLCFGPEFTDKSLETVQIKMWKSEGDMSACQTPTTWQVVALPPAIYRMLSSAYFPDFPLGTIPGSGKDRVNYKIAAKEHI